MSDKKEPCDYVKILTSEPFWFGMALCTLFICLAFVLCTLFDGCMKMETEKHRIRYARPTVLELVPNDRR